ncbi:hypothetical protein [Micromonospora sp. HK10]|uniref:hypothetical protein n=1 Tax=Micromonospora sp. HK10 TaxID=1538294 RepID=UPI000698CCF5|nr:hypothetical protein [Micromonospora sp. HK10]
MRSYRLLATTCLTTLVVALPGSVCAAAPAAAGSTGQATPRAADGPRAGQVTTNATDGPRTSVRLATGERVDVLRDGAGSGSRFRVLPAGGSARAGRYAYASVGGTLAVQPKGHRAQTIESRSGAQPASLTSTAAALYPVRLTINSPGTVAFKILYVWNRQTWTFHPVTDEEYTPNGNVQLPNGDYFAVALYSDPYAGGSYLLSRTFQIASGGATVRFDQSSAKETRIAVDDATAGRYTSAVWISVPSGDLAGFAGGGTEKVYVTPFALSGVSLRLHEILLRRGTSDHVPSSPYRYDLYHSFAGGVPSNPVVSVATASLARTVTSIRSQARATNGWLLSVPSTSDMSGAYLPSPVAIPSNVTEYVTPNQSFWRLVHYRQPTHDLTLTQRSLPAGQVSGETVGAAPFAPRRSAAVASTRDINRMSIYEYPALSDAAGNLGLDNGSTVAVNLTSGSETLASATGLSPYQSVNVTVPSGSATYRLTHTVTRASSWSRLSPEVRSEWQFVSAGIRYQDPLPLLDIDFSVAGLDAQNAAWSAPVRIDARAGSRRYGVTPTLTGLEYSTDDGRTWAALPVGAAAGGTSVELAVPAGAAFVSLRATASDDSGGSLRRTVLRAFAGPASQYDESAGVNVSQVLVNGGAPLTVAPSGGGQFTARFTATTSAGVAGGDVFLYRGPYASPEAVLVSESPAECIPATRFTTTCQVTFRIDPRLSLGRNALAGEWQVGIRALGKDRTSLTDRHAALTVPVRRQTKLTAGATPSAVTKGQTITVKGTLTQGNWETGGYDGYPGQAVTLQFRKAGTSDYVAVKTATVDQYGTATVKVTSSVSGYWRFVFAGSSTAAPVTSGTAYVKVG